MIKEYTKQISDLLEKINKENEENIESIIAYETSTDLCVGGMLCRYGELYQLVASCESFDEIAQQLEGLYNKDKFETYEDEIGELQRKVFDYIKFNYSFVMGKIQLLVHIKEELIMRTILEHF